MDAQEIYRLIRNAIRQLAHRESLYVIWAYSQFLQLPDFRLPNDIETNRQFLETNPRQGMLAEWTLEIMAREVLRNADEESRTGASLKHWNTLARIANYLRDLEGQLYAQVGPNNIQLELMRIAHRQFVWQQQRFGWRWIIRYYMLFNSPAISTLAEQEVGLTIDQIYLIGMAYIGSSQTILAPRDNWTSKYQDLIKST